MVADRTLSARYKMLFEGIFATMQTTHVPEFVMRHLMSPAERTDSQGRAFTAPLGLRRIESALLAEGGLTASDIICTTPESLPRMLGDWVKLVIVSSSDPLGQGMSNTTTDKFWKGELYTRYWMNTMMEVIRPAKQKYGFKVLGGGAGAWQWVYNPKQARGQGFDAIYEGYFEDQGPELVKDILAGRETPWHVQAQNIGVDGIHPIKHPSLLGIIELSRGCGKGCRFCTMASKKMGHLPVDTIVSDLEVNVGAGITSVVSGSEDFFRYGGTGVKPDFDKLYKLLTAMRRVKGLRFMQIDHGNIASIAQLTDDELFEIRKLLTWQARCDYLWVNMGIESANGHLVQASSPGKIAPFSPDDWEDIVLEVTDKMIRTGFFPVFSVILGLPGETPADVQKTINLVRKLITKRAVIFPIFYEPVREDEITNHQRFTLETMTLAHLDLYSMCYEQNFKLVPRMFWDNQRAAGVPLAKRTLIRALGKTEIHAWRSAFQKLRQQIPSPAIVD
ncbi:MAG: B12-binding domain-containing radical SAM protein [Sedimentisphaerales bacterium]|nr:B12-binding domain-containing radical SAM protein [Sedimentisphaerales bacterium]